VDADFVVGNPPWGTIAQPLTLAAIWADQHHRPVPGNQISAAFIWKCAEHVSSNGRVCLVLPTGTLFNHGSTALEFQRTLFEQHAVERVLNLADYQRFLFEEAEYPALVICYRRRPPESLNQRIEYWTPKADWMVTRAEVITIGPEDRNSFAVRDLLRDLSTVDAPQIWKRYLWATPRDWRLLDRLSIYARLRDHVRQAAERGSNKPWLMAEGFQPFGTNDKPESRKTLKLPTKLFLPARTECLDLFLLEDDCERLSSDEVETRRLIRNTDIFKGPHVVVAKGFSSIAYADFNVAFRHALRGINGPKKDRDLLIFLAAYLRSSLARYYLFHTSNWGVSRQEVHVEELLRLPFPLPDSMPDAKRGWGIVSEIGTKVMAAAENAKKPFSDRKAIVREATEQIEPLIDEYFDVLPVERLLIDDTIDVSIPSARPTRQRRVIETVRPSTEKQRHLYIGRVCETLNGWAKKGAGSVHGYATGSDSLGIGMAVLERSAGEGKREDSGEILAALDKLRKTVTRKMNAFELGRGVKIFDRNRLYVVKPLGQRFWTQTAALNDADEIAGTILLRRPVPEGAA
jgi:hypothetical protein